MSLLLNIIETFAIISFALMAGLYFIFSNTIMKALSQMPTEQGAQAMTKINDVIINPLFFTFFFGSALSAIYLIIEPMLYEFNGLKLSAGLLFLVGSFISTVVFNVPLNEKLKAAVMSPGDISQVWSEYLNQWTKWNHSRAIFSFVAAVLTLLS
ncbi:DUF1772 domain-containing protein [Aliikangiella marina]|uniref:DUF1772 domain-containing protein n=1 Tax=Aliikangiella marina TaxID=1712262 RepID=A0A545TJD9_9GAMM|nr:anthrone oxygenase family protein [Aliikangiella marina]TQV77349.1 DUF1772 domain-containing protein [Aliikangiella marina]